MSAKMTLEEKKARVLIGLRRYKIVKVTHEEKKDILSFIIQTPKEKEKMLLWCVLTKGTIGVAYPNQMDKAMKEIEVEKGIIVANGRYTQACRKRAVEKGIELIPQIFPAFNIFKHTLVPKHEIITSEEKEELLTKYGIQPYQLPRIRVSDPGAIAIGASPGDIIRIIRKSPTAGEYVGYRYVIED